MHVSRLTWPFPFLVRLGWATTKTTNPDLACATGRVFLLRGKALVFSTGFGALCNDLRQHGVWAEDLRCIGDWWARRHLAAEKQAGTLRGPIVFVGHSCGGRYSLYGAEALRRAGIAVDLVICLDVAFPPLVPSNVKRALNLYLGGCRLYPAARLRAEPGAETHIENIDLRAADSPIPAHGLHHLNITSCSNLQAFVLQRIRETVSATCYSK
jgi:hypothetical protein